jgi:Mrp family chromosome partitioning ATPase
VLTAGASSSNIIHLCNSERLKEVFSYIKKQYDVVVVDSAPILSVSDPSLLVPIIDGVLLVYRVGSTSRITLKRSKSAIESSKPNGVVNGLVLNNVVPELMVSKAYYYS